jgi:ribose transport system substrate-binding protein
MDLRIGEEFVMKRPLVLFVVLSAVIIGCGPAEPAPDPSGPQAQAEPAAQSDKPIRVALVANVASDFWKIAQAGTDKAKAELGCEVEFRLPAQSSAQEQMQIVEDLIARGVSGIAISPSDPNNQTEMLNKAASRVSLVTQDSDAPESNRVCYIGTNNYEAGRQAGEAIKQALPDGGRIMLFVGLLDAQNAQDRQKGIEEVLAGTGIEIVDTRTDEGDRMKAIANVQDSLVAHPDLACLVGLWSYNGPAILNGVRDSGKLGAVKIICFDEEDETLQGVKDGHILGTVVQQPFEFGYRSVQLLVQLAKGDTSGVPETKQIYVPTKLISQENVEAFWAKLKEQTGQS